MRKKGIMNRVFIMIAALASFFGIINEAHAETSFLLSDKITINAPQGKSVWGDIDADFDFDLIISGTGEKFVTKLFINTIDNGERKFIEKTIDSKGLQNPADQSIALSDYDHDSDLDLFVQGMDFGGNFALRAYQNDGKGNFVLDEYLTGLFSTTDEIENPKNGAIVFGDIDRDGDLDFIQLIEGSDESHIRVFENLNGSFSDQSKKDILVLVQKNSPLIEATVAIGDFRKNDQALDIGVRGYNERRKEEGFTIYENNPASENFEDIFNQETPISGLSGGDGALVGGDVNNDGFFDAMSIGQVSQKRGASLEVCVNNKVEGIPKKTGFSSCDQTNIQVMGGASGGFGDFNHDGFGDIVIAANSANSKVSIFCENGGIPPWFQKEDCDEISKDHGGANGDVSFADYDQDRDLDIMITGEKGSGLFENQSTEENDIPLPPSQNFSSSFDGESFTLSWDPVEDEFPAGLMYEYKMYTHGKSDNILTGAYGSPLLGNALIQQIGKPSIQIKTQIPFQEFRWKVRTIDQGLAASQWSDEQIFQGEQNVSGWGFFGSGTTKLEAEQVEKFFHTGWLSFQCDNIFYGNPYACSRDYGLKITPQTGQIIGYGWMGGGGSRSVDPVCEKGDNCPMGWIDFHPNPFPDTPDHTPIYDPNREHRVQGWSRILSLKEEGLRHEFTNWGWIRFGAPASRYSAWIDTSATPWELRGYIFSGGGFVKGKDMDNNVGLGWISLNCKDRNICDKSKYKVTMENKGNYYDLAGYGWLGNGSDGDNSNIGWVSFNGSEYSVKFDSQTNRLYGYAWLGGAGQSQLEKLLCTTHENCPMGWISINAPAFPETTSQNTAQFPSTFFQISRDDRTNPEKPETYYGGQIAGWARINTLKDQGMLLGQDDWGWIRLQGDQKNPLLESKFEACRVCTDRGGEKQDICLACDIKVIGEYQGTCSECSSCEKNGDQYSCDQCGGSNDPKACYDYGLNIVNFESGEFEGWAFSGDPFHEPADDKTDKGLGWLLFQRKEGGASPGSPPAIAAPYVSSEGTLYGKSGVGSLETFQPIRNRTNAFLIQSAGDIIHFTSEKKPDVGDPDFTKTDPFFSPVTMNRYSNGLGRIDLETTTTTEVGGGGKNIYGDPIVQIEKSTTALNLWKNSKPSLDGTIWVIEGDLRIDGNIEFQNSPSNGNGSGLIVVNKDLFIDHNMTYAATSISHIRELASSAFIVRGKIIISPIVETLSGVFIALGETPSDPQSGLISTGLSDRQLTINGLLFARDYEFQRTYIGDPQKRATFPEPAEKIRYDGRFILNTPPALKDFSKILPFTIDMGS